MVPDKNNNLINQNDDRKFETDIDLSAIYSFLISNKTLILKFCLSGLILGSLFSFTLKRTWKGEFQIVLNNSSNAEKEESISAAKFGIETNSSRRLKTEVKILSSPSVLMNVFEFVNKQKTFKGNSSSSLRFNDWKKNLKIDLEDGTTVLKLTYKDQDKDIIMPVLNRISNTYQEYSSRKRKRLLDLSLDYYLDQIAIYEVKSIEAIKELQKFAMAEDLYMVDVSVNSSINSNLISKSLNVEKIRTQSSNQIRLIDQKLESIKKIEDNPDKIIYLALSIPELKNSSNVLSYYEIEQELRDKKAIFKNNDKVIVNLNKKRNLFIKSLKQSLIGLLEAQKSVQVAQMKASLRDEGVILKYTELLTKASKEKGLLTDLEDNYRIVSLERARYTDPWELITNPTLYPDPVAPNKKIIVAFSLLLGFTIGVITAIIKDKKLNNLSSAEKINLLTNFQILSEISVKEK